jgi:UDP-N-acetylmuramoyl-L-alanyl-D-glutamate--2,6-diaminopimelate ligase
MEDYFRSKRRLFEIGSARRIVNVDDPYGRRLAEEFECLTFSAEGREANVIARGIELDASGAGFEIVEGMGGERISEAARSRPPAGVVRTHLPGEFNIANALGAFAAATALGVPPDTAAAALSEAAAPPGRMEPVEEGQPFAVLVDYAHTPDSVENVLRAAREVTDGRVISVIGAGGDRDREKRPKMGRAASRLSDLAIVTSDNPRSEKPEAIVEEVLAGVGDGDAVAVEIDRRRAIARALGEAQPGDIVVLAGKGHEQGQEFENGRKVPFDDCEVAREELRKLAAAR